MIRAVAVEATGRYVATASSDETLRIWEARLKLKMAAVNA